MVRFYLRLSARFRKLAIQSLRTNRFKRLSDEDKAAVSAKLQRIRKESEEVLRIMSSYAQGASKANLGYHISFGNNTEDDPGSLIFDMEDGSHCYYLDPPGICCCDPC